jgi:hypothetical protein
MSAFEGKADITFSGVKQISHFLDRVSAYDPNVWSGRALQENFVELAVSGLASMYPAFVEALSFGPSWVSARVRSH